MFLPFLNIAGTSHLDFGMKAKKKIILGVLAAVAFLAVLGQFMWLPLVGVALEDAVPDHTALILTLNKATLAKGLVKNSLSNIFLPDAVTLELADFEKNFQEKIPLGDDQTFLATVQPTRTSGIDVLLILPGSRWLNLELTLRSMQGWRVRNSIFRNHEIFTVETGDQKFALAKYRNLLLFARHPYLVENAISQLKNPAASLCKNDGFRKLSKRAKPAPSHLDVLLNLENFSGQFAPLIQPAKLADLQILEKFGSWVHLQLPAGEQGSDWQAAFYANPGHPLLAANEGAAALPFKNAFPTLPDNLAAVAWFSVKNFNRKNTAANWKKFFEKWAGNEIAFALGEPLENDEHERFALLKTNDAKAAETALLDFSKTSGAAEPVDFQMFKIYKINGTAVSELLGMGQSLPDPFVSVLGEYVLFSNSAAGIERWLGKYIAGQTFSKDVPLLQSLRTLPTEAQGFFYFESGAAWQQLSQFFDDRQLAKLGGNPLRFHHLAATMSHGRGNLCELTVAIPGKARQQQEDQPANILWRASLGSPAATAPFIFQNPRSGEMEVLVQDERHRLHLISRSGRKLWQRELGEPILSDFFQIDLYNNGEGQFVFSTAGGIFVIDRQGSDVAGFPLKLQVPASNGVTVIDFFQGHDYQFFIACENGNAYGFDEKGSPVEGWRPKEGIGQVRHPLVHFQAKGMDFMILLDEAGTMQVFQKNGADRFSKIAFDASFPQGPDFQASSDAHRIVACDENGKVYVTNLSGSNFRLSLNAGKNKDVRFAFADVTGDARKDYLALSGDVLAVYFYEGNNFKHAFTHTYPHAQDEVFPIRWRSQKSMAGTVSKDKKQISLLNGEGKLLPQFPLAGTTRFEIVDLLGDGKAVVVTGNGEQVVAYGLE